MVKNRGRANRKNRQNREEFLSNFRKDDKLIPVITLSICFKLEAHKKGYDLSKI